MHEVQTESGPPEPMGRFELGVAIVACLGLFTMWFGGQESVFIWICRLFRDDLPQDDPEMAFFLLRTGPYYSLGSLWFWVLFCCLGYMGLPMLYLRRMGRRLGDYYFNPRGFWEHRNVYLGMCAVVLVLVGIVSFQPSFQEIYPFYTWCGRSWFDLLAWEAGYALQFVALEFFFRAFLLEGMRRSLGVGAVYCMLLPYCMLHFQKTAAECLGSILAGLVLGLMAMRYRSIWGGILVHFTVALSMDIASLIQKGQFPPTGFFPDFG